MRQMIESQEGTMGRTISSDEIEALMIEAGEAGDREQVVICERALAGDPDAIEECIRVAADARAQ